MTTASRVILAVALCAGGHGASARAAQAPPVRGALAPLLTAGQKLYNNNRLNSALAKFRQALELDPEDFIANQYVARIDARLGNFKEAVDRVRALQKRGVSIYRSPDSRKTLRAIIDGIGKSEPLLERARHLQYVLDTIVGLPTKTERDITAQRMAIHAKLGNEYLHGKIHKSLFAAKPVAPETYFAAAFAYIKYGVRLPHAAAYFERTIDLKALALERLEGSGKPGESEREQLERRRLRADITRVEDFLAYTYFTARTLTPGRNRLLDADAKPAVRFQDITEAAGLGGATGARLAVGDYDGDGFEDLCIAGRIFRNDAGKTFTDATKKAGTDSADATAALWLDADNDGHLDLVCAAHPKLRLWRNRGNGTFEDVTKRAGLDLALPGVPEALAAADYDADGHIDLFVGCYRDPKSTGLGGGAPNFLFRNLGKGVFRDASEAAKIRTEGPFATRGCAWGDFDNDGRPDLYVANYRLQPNRLWVNQGDGTFADRAERLRVAGTGRRRTGAPDFGQSIGCAWGDVDNDGDLDLAVANLAMAVFIEFADPCALYLNLGPRGHWHFLDAFPKPDTGIRHEEMATDVSFCDVDNDGDLDLYLTARYRERPSFLYQNNGAAVFSPITWRSGALALNTWGHVWFDKDNDGDMDLCVGSPGSRLWLFENQGTDGAWLRVRLVGKTSNRLGIGSRITVAAGPLKLIREVAAGSGPSSQSSPVAHFGLGDRKGPLSVAVRWPNGHVQQLTNAPANALLTITEK